MAGTAATDPTAKVVPNVSLLSEWSVRLNGVIATCVEAVETVLLGAYGKAPVTAATDQRLATQLIQQGQASAGGATNWYAASQQLAAQGVPNTPYGPDFFAHNNWQATLNDALAQGKPVLFGLSNAQALHDDFTGRNFDTGVFGHAIAIVGQDATGYLAIDPNQDPSTQAIVHYSARNLAAAGASSMDIPTMTPDTSGGGSSVNPFNPGLISNLTGASTGALSGLFAGVYGDTFPYTGAQNQQNGQRNISGTTQAAIQGAISGAGSSWVAAILSNIFGSVNDLYERLFLFVIGVLFVWLGIHLIGQR